MIDPTCENCGYPLIRDPDDLNRWLCDNPFCIDADAYIIGFYLRLLQPIWNSDAHTLLWIDVDEILDDDDVTP